MSNYKIDTFGSKVKTECKEASPLKLLPLKQESIHERYCEYCHKLKPIWETGLDNSVVHKIICDECSLIQKAKNNK